MVSKRIIYTKSELESLKGTDNVDQLAVKFKKTPGYASIVSSRTRTVPKTFQKASANDLNPSSISLGPVSRTWQNGCQVVQKDNNRSNGAFKSMHRKHNSDSTNSFRSHGKRMSESSNEGSNAQPEWFLEGPDTIYDTFDIEQFQKDVNLGDEKLETIDEGKKPEVEAVLTPVQAKKTDPISLDQLISSVNNTKIAPQPQKKAPTVLTLADIENEAVQEEAPPPTKNGPPNPSVSGILNSLMNRNSQQPTNKQNYTKSPLHQIQPQVLMMMNQCGLKSSQPTPASFSKPSNSTPVMLSQIENNIESPTLPSKPPGFPNFLNPSHQFVITNGNNNSSTNGSSNGEFQSPILKKTISQFANNSPIRQIPTGNNPPGLMPPTTSSGSSVLNRTLPHLNGSQRPLSMIVGQNESTNLFLNSIISNNQDISSHQPEKTSSFEAFLQNRLNDLNLQQNKPTFPPPMNNRSSYIENMSNLCNNPGMQPIRRSIVKRSNYINTSQNSNTYS